MQFKKLSVMVVFVLLICFVPATLHAADYGDKSKAKVTWKTATLAPKNTAYARLFEEILLPELEKETKGDLYLKIYWGGVMGDDKQILKKMRIGQLQGAGLSGQGTFALSPEIPVLGLPFMFNDYDEVDYVKAKMIDSIDNIVRQSGFKMLLWLDQDFDQIYSKVPLNKLSEFPKAKFITWFGALEGRLLEKLGASPIPIDVTEIPSTMRAGAGDAMVAPSIWIVATQLYTTFKYVNSTKIRYTPAFNVVTETAWKETPEEHINKVSEMRVPLSKKFCKRSRQEADKCLVALIRYGIKDASPTPENLEKIKERSIPLWDELADELYSQDILDELTGHLAEYRALQIKK